MINFVRQMAPITLNAVGRPQDNLLATVVGLVVSLPVLWICGPFGALGAALAWCLRSVVLLPIGLAQVRRAVHLAPAAQLAGAAAPLAAVLAMAGGLALARQVITPGWSAAAALALLVPLGAALDIAVLGATSRRSLAQLGSFLIDGLRRDDRPEPAVGEGLR